MNRLFFFAALLAITVFASLPSCKVQEPRRLVAFYNLENLFDTINTPGVRDREFTPESDKNWNTGRYEQKLRNMASVIVAMADSQDLDAPAVVGLCEMENRDVLEDLVNSGELKDFDYRIVHEDSPDRRGIDVALIYRPEYFQVSQYHSVPLKIYDDDGDRIYTRDQLVVSGELDGEAMHFIVNHWPSRYGGQERSAPFRDDAARLSRSIVDSLSRSNPDDAIILMGDLNDDPDNESVRHHLRAGVKPQPPESDSLFNATAPLFFEGEGTLCYRGVWNMFDQMIVTPNLLEEENGHYYLEKTGVFDSEFLRQQEGDYTGYPFRTYVGDWYHGGYSDHFPSYVILRKKKSGYFMR